MRVDRWVWKIPWRRAWQPSPVFLSGESHGQRSRWATVHGVKESWIRLKWLSVCAWEKIKGQKLTCYLVCPSSPALQSKLGGFIRVTRPLWLLSQLLAARLTFKVYRHLYSAHDLHMESKHLGLVLKTFVIQTIFLIISHFHLHGLFFHSWSVDSLQTPSLEHVVLVFPLPLPSGEALYQPLHQSCSLCFDSLLGGLECLLRLAG